MAYESHDNVYYKFGMVRPNPKEAIEVRQIVTRFEVGPGGTQVSLDELKKLASGQSLQKRHFDGQSSSDRIDVDVSVGEGIAQFSKDELAEIYKIESEKAASRPAPRVKEDDLQNQVNLLQAQLAEMLQQKEEKRKPGRPKKEEDAAE